MVGWPPIRSYRKNCLQARKLEAEAAGLYVKVSMDGAPYLRKIDLKVYKGYPELLKALEEMFKSKVGTYHFFPFFLFKLTTQHCKEVDLINMRTKYICFLI